MLPICLKSSKKNQMNNMGGTLLCNDIDLIFDVFRLAVTQLLVAESSIVI
jgi:tryptophanase